MMIKTQNIIDEYLNSLITRCNGNDCFELSAEITPEVMLSIFANYLSSYASGLSLLEKENKIIALFKTNYFKDSKIYVVQLLNSSDASEII